MPRDQIITNLPDLEILNVSGSNFLKIEAKFTGTVECIHCESQNLRTKDSFIRKVRHISLGERLSELHLRSHKFKCLDCNKYFNQRFTGVLPRKRSSELFRKEISRLHHQGISQSLLSKHKKLSCSTVEKWYQDIVDRENRKFSKYCPKHMGIDEHFFSKKKGYSTTFADLGKNKIFNLALGRSEKSLEAFLKGLKGKEKVQTINMDLSTTYRSIARKHFKNALIVADRFHVIRLVNHHFMSTWKRLDEDSKYNRGVLSLMRTHNWNLDDDRRIKLKKYLSDKPALKVLYEFKQELCKILILKSLNAREFRKVLPKFLDFISKLRESGFEHMRKLGNTMDEWKEEIARMLRFTKNNSITEGFHTKMEMISRRAFGFRNFNNYRLRVRVHCGYEL